MYLIYTFLFGAWIIIMIPYFLYNAFVNRKYLPSLRERVGFLPKTLSSDGRKTIWIHACSVGETLSVQPLAHLLSERFPSHRLVFSCVTRTGRIIAEDRFTKYGKGNVFYVPIDFPLFVERVLRRIKPDILITIDTEIWPNIIRGCNERGIPVVMANGRISAKSFRYYQWVQPLMAPVLKNYVRFLMKDQEDANRIRRMGALASKVFVTGSIKYDRDVVEKDVADSVRAALDIALKLTASGSPVIVAGSTHDGEEVLLFEVLKRLRAQPETKDARLLVAPRHPERFNSVASLAESAGLSVARRTVGAKHADTAVLLLDSVGELAAAYQFAEIAFVGGSLIPHGGQSIMEPALYAKAIVVGPHTENFPGTVDDFREHDAFIQTEANEERKEEQISQLVDVFTKLLTDENERNAMGLRAQSLFAKSKGATALTVKYIAEILEARQ